MTAHSLSQAHLKELLHYDPDTGVFTWRNTCGRRKQGNTAGSTKRSKYVYIQINGATYGAHRLAFLYVEGALPAHEADHINHIRDDNRWCNLRHATRTENSRNTKRNKRNTSGVTGVYPHGDVWRVVIGGRKQRTYGGQFKTKQEAITRRRQLEREHQYHANHGT